MGAKIFLRPDGTAEGIYSDEIDYAELGDVFICRASHVEWDDETQSWSVTFLKDNQKVAGFKKRQEALDFEVETLERELSNAKA